MSSNRQHDPDKKEDKKSMPAEKEVAHMDPIDSDDFEVPLNFIDETIDSTPFEMPDEIHDPILNSPLNHKK